jgi:hypothetical protein
MSVENLEQFQISLIEYLLQHLGSNGVNILRWEDNQMENFDVMAVHIENEELDIEVQLHFEEGISFEIMEILIDKIKPLDDCMRIWRKHDGYNYLVVNVEKKAFEKHCEENEKWENE